MGQREWPGVLIARYEIARLLFLTDSTATKEDAEADWDYLLKHPKYLVGYYRLADALIAAGYEKHE